MNYSFLDRLHHIDPYRDINCQKLADYLAAGLNYAIAQYDLGDECARTIGTTTIPPIGDTTTIALTTTKNLAPNLYCGCAGITGAVQVMSIDSPTTATFLNISVSPFILNTSHLILTKIVAVRDTRSYDAIDIDNSCYPMLKVFRQKERVNISGIVEIDLVISYAMLLPDRDKLPGMMHWVARHIDKMLSVWSQIDNSCPFQILPKDEKMSIEYRIMVDNLQNPVYAYLRVTLVATEFN